MSDQVKVSTPWGKGDSSEKDGSDVSNKDNLIQVPCPYCGQALALGREFLGGHCLCSVCDGLMLVSLKKAYGGKMAVVAEKVDKITGEKISESSSSSSPEMGGAAMEEDWENTRPVKIWAGSAEAKNELVDDDMDLGATMPIPGVAAGEDEMDLEATMPIPTVSKKDSVPRGLGATMPVPTVGKGGQGGGDDDWDATAPSWQQPAAPKAAEGSAGAWPKANTAKQGVKLAPPGGGSARVSAKAPPPTSGAVPTITTPPVKPPVTSGSVPTLDAEQMEARQEAEKEAPPAWQPPGLTSPIGAESTASVKEKKPSKAEKKKAVAEEKKKGDPFGNKSSSAVAKKKVKITRKRKGRKVLIFVMLVFLLLIAAAGLFFVAPSIFPGGQEARALVDGKLDEFRGKIEEYLAERASSDGSSQEGGRGATINLAPGDVADGQASPAASAGAASATDAAPAPVHTRESDAALQKILSQEGESVIRRFYGASTVDEKLAFVAAPDEASADMKRYFVNKPELTTVRSVMFRGATRDSETGYYYGVFDVRENENDSPHRWCVVDPGTGLYQVDWILYRQIAASGLSSFLRTPAEAGVKKTFHMLVKLQGGVAAEENPWYDDVVEVGLQVPMISSPWYEVKMKKALAGSSGLTTKLASKRMTMAVVEIEWLASEKNPGKRYPAIVAIKRWGAWARDNF
ncbi:MAG: hypothetical protein L3J39_09160 [Verrucomicrobiales bacterium]|nr:hypothetical protein [Verrucomicrobiales bacterium]